MLKESLSVANTRLKQKDAVLRVAAARVVELEKSQSELEKSKEECKRAETRVRELERSQQRLREELSESRTRISELEQQLRDKTSQSDAASRQTAATQIRLNNSEQALRHSKQETATANKKIEFLQQKYAALYLKSANPVSNNQASNVPTTARSQAKLALAERLAGDLMQNEVCHTK